MQKYFYLTFCIFCQQINMEIFNFIDSSNIERIKLWVEEKIAREEIMSKYEETPLIYALQTGNVEASEIFIERKIYIHNHDIDGWFPVHYTASDDTELLLLSKLIEKGASVNVITVEGNTPLHFASCMGLHKIVLFLVENGAEINVFNNLKKTPLHDAIKNFENSGSFVTAKIYLDEGASLFTNDFDGKFYLKKAVDTKSEALVYHHLKLQKFTSCRNFLTLSSRSILKFQETFKFSFIK